MNFLKFILSILYQFLLIVSSLSWGQDISISPSILHFSTEPGHSASNTIKITNHGEKIYEFQVNLRDWTRDSIGRKEYRDPGTLAFSNANWIRMNESIIRVLPNQVLNIPIQMEIPLDLKEIRSSNSMLFLTQINGIEQETNHPSIGIKINYEFGVQIFHTPITAKKGEVVFTNISYQEQQESKVRLLRIDFENNGYIHKNGQIRTELTNIDTGKDFKLEPVAFAIMPLDKQFQTIKLPKEIEEGNYKLVSFLDLGENYELNIGEKKIHVKL